MEKMMSKQDPVYHEEIMGTAPIDNKYKHRFSYFMGKDYRGKTFGFSDRILDTLCIDMDEIETDRCGNNDTTMDLTLGIAQYDETLQTFSFNRFLPVELKLGCDSFDRIKKTDLLHKDQHTRGLLTELSIVTDKHSIFIFTKEVTPSAINNKSRWDKESNSNDIKYWKMMSPSDYNEYIKFKEDYPYKAISDLNAISKTISDLFAQQEFDRCIDYIDNQTKEAERYKIKYNLNECQKIAETLISSINDILTNIIPPPYNDFFVMLRDEVISLIK